MQDVDADAYQLSESQDGGTQSWEKTLAAIDPADDPESAPAI